MKESSMLHLFIPMSAGVLEKSVAIYLSQPNVSVLNKL